MYRDEILKVAETAEKKKKLINASLPKYFVTSILAGFYIVIGVALSYTTAAMFNVDGKAYSRLAVGLTFSIALSLIYFAGAELFTGNNFVLTVGLLEKKIKLKDWTKILVFCFLGNLIGTAILGFLYVKSGAPAGETEKYIVHLAEAKASLPVDKLIIKGILCNFAVCLAVWVYYRLKEETAKLIMIFMCILSFATAGFEHSIANMGVFFVALLSPHDAALTIWSMVYNISWVTLGNLIGGAVFLAVPYWYISRNDKKAKSITIDPAA